MSGLTLRFLGSGDAFGSGGRLQACLLLDGPDGPLLLDCGASSLIAMRQAGVDPNRLGWVCLSHLHGDHFGGLPFLVLDGQFRRRLRPLVVAGPPGCAGRIEAAMEVLFPGSSRAARRFGVEYLEFADRMPRLVGPARVTPFEVPHPSGAPAYALRVEYGSRIVAYSGDTGWTDALLDVARGADVFVCEAYGVSERVPHHLSYATLAARRSQLECRRLVLTHLSEEMLAHLDRLAALDAQAAHDGLTIEL